MTARERVWIWLNPSCPAREPSGAEHGRQAAPGRDLPKPQKCEHSIGNVPALSAVNSIVTASPFFQKLFDVKSLQLESVVMVERRDDQPDVVLGGHPKPANEGHLKTGQ